MKENKKYFDFGSSFYAKNDEIYIDIKQNRILKESHAIAMSGHFFLHSVQVKLEEQIIIIIIISKN